MTKIAFLIRSLGYGGAERQLVALVSGLDSERFDVTVLQFYAGGALEKELRDRGVRLISLEKRGRWDLCGFLWRLIRRLRAIRPDVLHGYLGIPNLLTIFLKPFLSGTRMIWGIRASNVDASRYDWLVRLTFQLERVLARFADCLVINSNAGRAYHLAHGFPPQKMVVIPNGIDTARFRPDARAGQQLRTEWGVFGEAILIGLVGRLDPMKDHPTFLKAAALLSDKRGDVRFVCVGAGPESYARELRALAARLGIAEKVVWAGPHADMAAVHNALSLASSSSSYGEGFPNVIGEAMACGVPCVVTDVGDSAWVVGETGAVAPPQHPEALAAGWTMLLEKDTRSLGLKARARIVENFSVGRLVEDSEKVILARDS